TPTPTPLGLVAPVYALSNSRPVDLASSPTSVLSLQAQQPVDPMGEVSSPGSPSEIMFTAFGLLQQAPSPGTASEVTDAAPVLSTEKPLQNQTLDANAAYHYRADVPAGYAAEIFSKNSTAADVRLSHPGSNSTLSF